MGYSSHTVVFLARATRLTGGICLLIWLIAVGLALFSGPDEGATATAKILQQMVASAVLYLAPGVILFVLAAFVKAGRLWPAPVILLISALSLFKLVLMMTSLGGPYFAPPPTCEIPARLACALLSVACVFAWEDLADINRTRGRTPRGSRATQAPRGGAAQGGSSPPKGSSRPKGSVPLKGSSPPSKSGAPPKGTVVPPSTQIPRPRMKRDEPPASQTPWS